MGRTGSAATLGKSRVAARIARMIDILLNGEPRTLASEQTVAQLLAELQLPAQTVAVEVNLELVPRTRHAERALRPGDQVEIVTFKGGG